MNRRSFLALLGLSSLVGVASKAAGKSQVDFDAILAQMGVPDISEEGYDEIIHVSAPFNHAVHEIEWSVTGLYIDGELIKL